MDRFKREAMVSAQLKHPNIVTIYDIGDSEGMSYIAMEFIDGVGLDRVIAGAGRLPVERAASLAAQVADALDFAHKHNVVHRDIKPANIMVEAGDRVKVTDFGIAKVTDSAEHLTATGSLLGTPSYMSPEQARGAAIDGRSDLFAVGAIVYEMVAGKKAFRGDSITGLIFKIITEEPLPLKEQDPAIPDELVRIVARALVKDPAGRYQAGREMADDLLTLTRPGSTPTLRQSEMATTPGYVPGPTTYIPGSSPTLASSPPTQNAPGPPTHVAPAAVTRMSPAVATKVSPPPSVRGPAPAPPAPPGSKTGLILGLLAGAFVLLLAAGVGAFLFLRSRPSPSPTPFSGPGTTPSTTLVALPPSPEAAPSAVATPPVTNPETSPSTATTLAAAHPTPAPTTEAGRRSARNEPPATTLPPVPAAEPEAILDREPPQADGRAAGDHAAETFRESRGGTNGTFGTNRRFGQRERFPHTNQPAERKAIFVLLNVISFEEAYQKMHGRYGTFQEVLPSGDALPHPNAFQRHGYRFQLQADKSEFKVVATPLQMGLRPFVADDSGNVRFADE
jgi:serine/threonine-protein kinase